MPEKSKTRSRKEELLAQTVDWLMVNAAGDFTLRRLAADLNTSARMLVYYFGSREGLFARALETIAARWIASVSLPRSKSPRMALEILWRETLMTAPAKNLHLLTFQIWASGLASRDPIYEPFLDSVVGAWTNVIAGKLGEIGMEEELARTRATLIVAAIEGLLLHHLTREDTSVECAFNELLFCIDSWTIGAGDVR